MILDEKEPAPQLRHHRRDAPCTVVCPVNVITRVDGVVQSNESLCVSYELYGIACPFGIIEFSDNRPLDTPASANTSRTPSAPPVSARASTLLDWVPGIRAIAVKCDPYNFDEQGPTCVRMYPTKALHLVDSTDIVRISKRKYELTFNMDSGDLTLFQQVQNGEAKRVQSP